MVSFLQSGACLPPAVCTFTTLPSIIPRFICTCSTQILINNWKSLQFTNKTLMATIPIILLTLTIWQTSKLAYMLKTTTIAV